MNQVQTVKKWSPILESYYKDLSSRMLSFLSEYAERHSKNESMDVVHSGNVEVATILPMALKTLVSCQILDRMHWYVRPFEAEVQPKSYFVTADYTQGRRDKVESVENGLSEKISDEISKEAIENMFKLGDINRYYHRSDAIDKGFVPEAEHVLESDPQTFLRMMKKYLCGEAFKLSSGEPFIICNPHVASLLILKSEEGEYTHIQPLSKCMTMNRAFVVGEYCGAAVFVDPTMGGNDFRVLFGSSNSESTGGLVFEPLHVCYNMNVTGVAPVSGDGLSKVSVQSSYRFHSGSENSKCSYLTVKFEFDK